MKYILLTILLASYINAMNESPRWWGLPEDIVLKVLEYVQDSPHLYKILLYHVPNIDLKMAQEAIKDFHLMKHAEYGPELFSLAQPLVCQKIRHALYRLYWQDVSQQFLESVKTLVGKEESLIAAQEIKTCPKSLPGLVCMLSMMKLIDHGCLDIGSDKISTLIKYQNKIDHISVWPLEFCQKGEWSLAISDLFQRCLTEAELRTERCLLVKNQKGRLSRGQIVVMLRNAEIAKKPSFMCKKGEL